MEKAAEDSRAIEQEKKEKMLENMAEGDKR